MSPTRLWLAALVLFLCACGRGAAPDGATEAELRNIGGQNDNAAAMAVAARRASSRRAADEADIQAAEARGRADAAAAVRRADAEELERRRARERDQPRRR